MVHTKSNAVQARAVIRDAIRNGLYTPGSVLPSTREFAAQFQINRNTALKIYHELASEHLIELAPHHPPVVIGVSASTPGVALRERVRDSLQPYLLESRLIGMPQEDMRRMLSAIADEFFGAYQSHTIYFAECNPEEARTFAQELTIRLGAIVQPILLDQLCQNLAADIIVTPYFHLQEAKQILGAESAHLAGLIVTADSSDIARIVEMVTTGPMGVAAVNLQAAERLRKLLEFQVDVPMLAASVQNADAIRDMLSRVECVACTVRAYATVQQSAPEIPISLVQYHADDQSIELLRREIQRIRA